MRLMSNAAQIVIVPSRTGVLPIDDLLYPP